MTYEVTTWESNVPLFLYDKVFLHYYWTYDNSAKFDIHNILNTVRPNFPLELTNLIIDFVVSANKRDLFESLFVISRRDRVHSELCLFKMSMVGITEPKSSRWVKNVDPCTWLETIAYEQTLAVFNKDPTAHSLVMEYPYLRNWLAQEGLKGVKCANLRAGREVYERFCIDVKGTLRIILSALINGLDFID